MGTTPKTLSQLLSGQTNISNDLAKKLSVMMGTSAEVWQRLQNTYDLKLIEIQQARDFEKQKEILKQIDYRYFVEVAALPQTRNIEEKIASLCAYFKVSDLKIMLRPDFLVSFRSGISDSSEKKVLNSRAWIQTAMNMAQEIETEPYNAERLKKRLPDLRKMTLQQPEFFLPEMRNIFAECGVTSAMVNLGGNVQTYGTKPDGKKWKIAVQDPKKEGNYLCIIDSAGQAIITSGGYERYFEEDGVRYHHIIDPSDGYPADNGLVSVTIVSANGTLADGLSTSLFVMGRDKAIDYWREHSGEFEMVLYTDGGELLATEGLKDILTSEYAVTYIGST
jgi:cytidylate kinase